WRFLPDAMWSEVPAVQVLAWRMLNRLKSESWAADALDILYLDEETLAWAEAVAGPEEPGEALIHKDAFGNVLQNGDSVVLTKTLDVKGRSEEHTSELQSRENLVCRLLLEKKKIIV